MIKVKRPFGYYDTALGIIGRTGENDTRTIDFDCTTVLTEYPDANIICVCLRPGDDEPYTIPLSTDGDHRILTLASADLEKEGRLTLELRMVDGDKVLKSARFTGTVTSSLQGEGDAPGIPVRDTLDRLDAEIKAAQAVVDDIRAKLDAGEFDGPQGPKGDPGSDASVTAENIEAALGYAPVKDVQMAGTSVLENGVANVPIAQGDAPGVVSVLTPQDSGILNDNGSLRVSYATDAEISSRTGTRKAIVCANMDYAVKAAMCDGKGAAWTDAEQKSARERMGVSGEFELIEEITLSENVMNVAREAFPDGTPYNLRSLIIVVDSTNVENRPEIDGWVRLNAKLPPSGWAYIAPGKFVGTDALFSFFVYRVSSDGSVDSYFVSTIDAMPTAYTQTRFYVPSNIIRFGMHINDFLLYSTGEAIPANTKISIYGVRV